jgi:hypothetical protein
MSTKSPLSQLIAKVEASYEPHKIYGEVMSWRSLESHLKEWLPRIGATLTRRIDFQHITGGVIVHVTVTIQVGEEVLECDGAAFAPIPGDGKRDEIRVAVTAASRQALAFMFLAGAEAREGGDEPPEPMAEPIEPMPKAERRREKPEAPRPRPAPAQRSEPVPEPIEPMPKQEGFKLTEPADPIQAMALAMSQLPQIARANLIREVKSITGRADIESLKPEQAKALAQRLAEADITKAYVEYVKAPLELKQQLQEEYGMPWIFSDQAAEAAAKVLAAGSK